MNALESELRKKIYEADHAVEKNMDLKNRIVTLEEEAVIHMQRINRLKQRKRKMDMDSKVCQNCKRDFKDSENFNWSCRTH